MNTDEPAASQLSGLWDMDTGRWMRLINCRSQSFIDSQEGAAAHA